MHQLPDDQYEKLNAAATAAGYADVSAFIEALSQTTVQPNEVSEENSLNSNELAASLALIDQSVAEFEAGGGLSLDEARQRTQERFQQLTQ